LELHNSQSEIKKRRDLVAVLHARSMTETEIAKQIGVDQSVVSRDLKAIKEDIAQDFVCGLARFDLAYYYKNCLDTIEQIKREGWSLYNENREKPEVSIRDKLAPLTLIKDCAVDRYRLLAEGPAIMAVKTLENRLNSIERNIEQKEFQEVNR
jgi:DNA-binding transcriptional ArsR family regulator